ncbi:hypothetical protein ACFQ1I_05615 [Kitasatospora arboriphila]
MAEACADTLRARGWTTTTVDAMALLGSTVGGRRSRLPPHARPARPLRRLPLRRPAPRQPLALLADSAARTRLTRQVRLLLDRHRPDLVVSVFATATSAVNDLRAGRPGMRHFVFCTDVTPHRLWVQDGTDLFLVTSEVAACAVRRYRPDAPTAVVPPPLRKPFYRPPGRAEARAGLGVPDGAPCVLLMSGSWGLGPLARTAAAIADAGPHVLAVASRNPRWNAACAPPRNGSPGCTPSAGRTASPP